MVGKRLPNHGEPLEELQRRKILIDGKPGDGAAAADLHHDRHRPDLLRDHPEEGRRGLRRGNFKALFESMELDQYAAAS